MPAQQNARLAEKETGALQWEVPAHESIRARHLIAHAAEIAPEMYNFAVAAAVAAASRPEQGTCADEAECSANSKDPLLVDPAPDWGLRTVPNGLANKRESVFHLRPVGGTLTV